MTARVIYNSVVTRTVAHRRKGQDKDSAEVKMKASFVCLCIALFLLQAQGRPRAQLHNPTVKTDRPIIGKETKCRKI